MSELSVTKPIILSHHRDEEGRVLTLQIPEDLDYFRGHFPGSPILPGVVQLHWAIDFIKSEFNLQGIEVVDVEVLKFKVVTPPGQLLSLTLKQTKANKYTFLYESDKGLHSSGRIVFEAIS